MYFIALLTEHKNILIAGDKEAQLWSPNLMI